MFQMGLVIVVGVGVFLVSFLVRGIALGLDIVDKPSPRKIHKQPVSLLGGVAIYLGFLLGVVLYRQTFREVFVIFTGATLILIVGLIDDIRGLSAQFRFIVQTIASLIVIGGGVRISFFPPGFLGNFLEILITLIWLVGVTNAFNYLDGLDGLACGSAIINSFYFSLILYINAQPQLGLICLILLFACLGFLPHNFRKEKIFLGDAGSTFLGFMLASIALAGNWAEDNIIKIAIPILILGVPIFDMVFTTIIRIKEGKVKTIIEWLRYGGKDHFHHYLVYLGLSPLGAVFFIWTITFALGLNAVMLRNDRAWEGILTLAQASVIFAIIGVLIVIGRRKKSGWQAVDSS
ncbi:MAG: undecaprenyl/decaprenyl-phosphate alpha-N-acetylglucosaminyl 1-phosphate transferase [Candidatus Duberdicusella sinuisediminis]|nr:MAG: undecaprenyl/decaprenyl-phosphate alpha-N-acetylglucosaminyl 1-phosphate transferase [Candidatus Omnitrophota bacterium]